MTDKKTLLAERRRIKRKKPIFGRKDSNKKKRIESDVWRKARGCDNKQRLHRKGHKKTPKQGYRSPLEVRGLDSTGLAPVLVSNISQVAGLGKEHGLIIASGLGDRKRKLIIHEAQKKSLTILNLDVAKALEQIDARLKERQSERKKQLEEKKLDEKAKKEHKKDEKKAPEQKQEELSDEEKRKLEKEEKDRLLTSKQ